MIIVDVETTGVDPSRNSIVSIGALDFDNPTDQFYRECRIWNGANVSQESFPINGFTESDIVDPTKDTDEEIVKDFLKWTESKRDKTIAGENPSFDRDFIRLTAQRYHLNWPFAYRTLDLHSVCYTHMIKSGKTPPVKNDHSGLNLELILEYCGIPGYSLPHNALTDTKLEAECLSRLLFGKKLLKEYEKYKIPW